MVLTNRTCPAENDAAIEQSSFWDGQWDAHEVGWLIAGCTALISTVISFTTVFLHARNYYIPKEQRQILMYGPDYAVALVAYEALVLAAFLMLLLQYVGESTEAQKAALMQKEKRKIPIPFCCIRFRPSKPYFLHALKWSVLQYSLLRPLISIAGIITNAFGVLCPTQYSVYYAGVYLDSVDFVSITVALYGLIVFYAMMKDRLVGKQPLAKFLGIKGIVMITFYQGFIFGVLEDYNVIKATKYWTAQNVGDGLQALCTCCEMVIFSCVFHWAFSYKLYKAQRPAGAPHTNPFWALLDSFNYSDFVVEAWRGIVFAVRFILRRPGTHASGPLDIDRAFLSKGYASSDSSDAPMRGVQVGGYGLEPTEPKVTSSIPPAAFGRQSGEEGRGRFPPSSRYQQETAEEYEQRTAYEDQQAGHDPFASSRTSDGYGRYQAR